MITRSRGTQRGSKSFENDVNIFGRTSARFRRNHPCACMSRPFPRMHFCSIYKTVTSQPSFSVFVAWSRDQAQPGSLLSTTREEKRESLGSRMIIFYGTLKVNQAVSIATRLGFMFWRFALSLFSSTSPQNLNAML